MGTFVQGLTASQFQLRAELAKEKQEKDRVLTEMDRLIGVLADLEKQDSKSQETIQKLKEEVAKLQRTPKVAPTLDPYSATGGLASLAGDYFATVRAAEAFTAKNALLALTNNDPFSQAQRQLRNATDPLYQLKKITDPVFTLKNMTDPLHPTKKRD
jgi:hypothetical protein